MPIQVPAEGSRRERVAAVTWQRGGPRVRARHRRIARRSSGWDHVLPDLGRTSGARERRADAPTDRLGRADLHIHTLASDGVSARSPRSWRPRTGTGLDVIAITDHERIDAAHRRTRHGRDRGMHMEVIVGEEVSTRGGHVLGLFIDERIRPWGSLRVGDCPDPRPGGPRDRGPSARALSATCASGRSIRSLLADRRAGASRRRSRRSTQRPPARAGARKRLRSWPRSESRRSASSDAHRAEDVGQAFTTFEGSTAADLRRAIESRTTAWEGSKYTWPTQVATFRRQLGKYAAGVRDNVGGKVRRDGTGRDLGYPGGRLRPPRTGCSVERGASDREDRPRHPVYLPAARRRQRPRPLPVREPDRARPRCAHHLQIHGPQRHSEGDIIRLGYGFSVRPTGRSGR